MDLDKELKKSGFYEAVDDLEALCGRRDDLLKDFRVEGGTSLDKVERLVYMDAEIDRQTKALDDWYEATVKMVDVWNDRDLLFLQAEETLEQACDYYDTVATPENAKKARDLLNKFKGEDDNTIEQDAQ
jgi:hypothetical protein